MDPVEQKLEEAKNLLVNLTLKNRFLNFQPTKKRTVALGNTDLKGLYQALVQEEKKLRIAVKEESDDVDASEHVSDDYESTLWADTDKADLESRLRYVHRFAKNAVEEKGYTALHLALGFLHWSESPSSEKVCRAPLVLIPVDLVPKGPNTFAVAWTKADVQSNHSLSLKLREQGIELPDLPDANSPNLINSYFSQIREVISGDCCWAIEPEIYLDFFDFTKMVMYRDLDCKRWPSDKQPRDHLLLKRLFDESFRADSPAEPFREDRIDKDLDFQVRYYVMDADPSQIAAVEDLRNGLNSVIQGPPGTGKSQTIVNLIAELMGVGKKALFVSEKLAALEVVKKRLDDIGLGDFCLSLHGNKLGKKAFLEELKSTLDKKTEAAAQDGDDAPDYDELNDLRDRLNRYAEAVGAKHPGLGKTIVELIGVHERSKRHFQDKGGDLPNLDLFGVADCSPEQWKTAKTELQQLINKCPDNAVNHPFRGCRPTKTGPMAQIQIKELLERCISSVEALEEVVQEWRDWGVNTSPALNLLASAEESASAVRLIASYRHRGVPFKTIRHGKQHLEIPADILDELGELQGKRYELCRYFREESFSVSPAQIKSIRDDFSSNLAILGTLFGGRRYRAAKEQLSALFVEWPETGQTVVLNHVDALISHLHECEEFRQDCPGPKLFGTLWHDLETDRNDLHGFVDALGEFVGLLKDGGLLEDVNGRLESVSEADLEGLNDTLVTVELERQKLEADHAELAEVLSPEYESIVGSAFEEAGFGVLKQTWAKWKDNIETLHEWLVFQRQRDTVRETLAASVVTAFEEGNLEKDDLMHALEGCAARSCLDRMLNTTPALTDFTASSHEASIEKFRQLDTDIIEKNRVRLRAKLCAGLPSVQKAGPNDTALKVLKFQLKKAKNLKPIRKLFAEAANEILAVKPCVMMSPLSVAQYLEPGCVEFDVVIFDEASQVRPADAFGAILRGRQLVVIGDRKQLPPTSFFDKMLEGEEAEDSGISDIDSILDLCWDNLDGKKDLRWHYRSLHESLIAVSNREFYGNKLHVFPSPFHKNDRFGLHFSPTTGSVYDKGKSRTNRKEARIVAEAVVKHLAENPEDSLGVGTFSSQQREAIWDELDKMRLKNPSLDQWLSSEDGKQFFVKNLELIQGDERDVIFISVGYGYDATGGFTQNFGPLNQEGGERRLNVLITRARKKCVVFCNFPGNLIQTNASSQGVKALRSFLEYARTGAFEQVSSGEPESPFEESVHDFLKSEGFEVHSQVGSGSYRIDLAVPHPANPGEYVLGIECDGASYHSSVVARERDRLRQQVLESRGWKIHRVWSTDWYQNRPACRERLSNAVNDALKLAQTEETDTNEDASAIDTEPPPEEPAAPVSNEEETEQDNQSKIDDAAVEEPSRHTVLVPPQDDLPDTLLWKAYNNEELVLTPTTLIEGLEKYYRYVRSQPRPCEQLGLAEASALTMSVVGELCKQRLLNRTESGDWKLTRDGFDALKGEGLVPDDEEFFE